VSTPVPLPTSAPTLPGLVASGVLDASLAALAWLLLERGVPVLVAGPDRDARSGVAEALAAALPEARRPGVEPGGDRLVRVAGQLDRQAPQGILRAALAATTRRSGLLAAVEADDLAAVLELVARQGLTADEASFLGVVIVLGTVTAPGTGPGPATGTGPGPGAGSRVVAAHYLRPVVRDAGGHPRRLGPAVLAAWDDRAERWEDFAWGIVPDLAERCRTRAGDFEVERAVRAGLLADLAIEGRQDARSFDAAARRLALASPLPAG
jgi:hypothetical protein